MRIAHLTDLHIQFGDKKSAQDFEVLRKALFRSLEKEHNEKRIDLVLITGDLVDKGGGPSNKSDCFDTVGQNIITPLASQLNLGLNRFVIIPGNHDVQQQTEEDVYTLGGVRVQPLVKINELITQNYSVLLETKGKPSKKPSRKSVTVSKKPNYLQGLNGFKTFERNFYKNHPFAKISNFESCFVIELGDIKIGVAALNSAWSCHSQLDKDFGANPAGTPIAFGTVQIQRAAQYLNEENKTDFNIALVHHPLESKFYSEEEEKEIKQELSYNNFSMLFCGHTHKVKDRYLIETDSDYYLIVTRSSFSDPRGKSEDYHSGFSLVDITYKADDRVEITRHFRKYFHRFRNFGFDVDEAYNGTSVREIGYKNKNNRAFINYLKNENPNYDPVKKLLLDKVNSATQQYLMSYYPDITNVALDKILKRMSPTDSRFIQMRNNFRMDIEIQHIDADYFSIVEKQSYSIDSHGAEVSIRCHTFMDRFLDGKDKSDVEVIYFKVNGEDKKEKFKQREETESLKGVAFAKQKRVLEFSDTFSGSAKYDILREIRSINSMTLNRVWRIEVSSLFFGYEINIANPDRKYQIELFNSANNSNSSNIGPDGKIRHITISTTDKKGVLIPGDLLFIFIN